MRRRTGRRVILLALLLAMAGAQVSAAPVAGQVHFSAAGDYAANTNTSAVLQRVASLDDDFHLALGDLSYGAAGAEQAWCDFVTPKVGAGFPFELLSGNHESDGLNGNINDFAACLPNQLPGLVGTYGRQYYVDVPAVNPLVRYVALSPALRFPPAEVYDFSAGSPRYLWTERAIDGARTAGIPWVVVGMHKPCLTVGKYACDPGADVFNLLLQKKVDLVLSGHEHTYQRTKQLGLGTGCTSIVPGSFNAACVKDSDSELVAGAGTVAAVVGTGGQSLYDVNAADPEADYFAALSGANSNPTHGVLDVVATADTFTGTFQRAAGGTFADTFTITRSTGTANQPPVAAFTPSCTDLSCAFDGTSSTDADGVVASYAWDFGDGSTGTGLTPSHPYLAAGTYTVGLTVTDDAGATASTSRVVTVSSGAATVLVSDPFNRTVASGLGTAPTGGTWTYSTAASNYSVSPGYGNVRVAAGSTLAAYLAGTSAASSDLRLSFGLDKQPGGSGLQLSALGRRVATVGSYVGKVKVSSTGAVSLELTRRPQSGSEVILSASQVVPGVTHTVGELLNLRLQVTGGSPTTIKAKVWKAGTVEPSTWQRTATDSIAGLQTGGSTGVLAYLSGAATNAPVTVRMDEITVTVP